MAAVVQRRARRAPAMLPTGARRPAYVLFEPGGEYSLAFLERFFLLYGLRPICLYADERTRTRAQRENPVLRSHLVEAVVVADDLEGFAAEVLPRYDICAVVPHFEHHVEPAGRLSDLLQLGWNSHEVIVPFRDKVALKARLAAAGVRVPVYRAFTAADPLDPCDTPPRVVIKPNDGAGNVGIGVFDRHDRAGILRHLARHPGRTWILEERIGGVEYSINGHVRADGEVTVFGITRYDRCSIGDAHTVYDAETQCATTDAHFAALTAYAGDTLRATGLRRSPYHLEVKVDDRGPCIIDLAARFGGAGLVQSLARTNPTAPDPFTVAVHDFLGRCHVPVPPIDPAVHDENLSMFVYGLADEACVIRDLVGCEAVENLPGFARWIMKPYVGASLHPTSELYSAPYIIDFRAPDCPLERQELIALVRRTIRWNTGPVSPSTLAATGRRSLALLRNRGLDAAALFARRIGARR